MALTVIQNADKTTPDYCPTYAREEPFINREHAEIMDIVSPVHGQLRPEDAWKLYEMAYFAGGPILEIGCLHGKSTTVLALGIRASGRPTLLISVDVNQEHRDIARENVKRFVPEVVPEFRLGNSSKVVAALDVDLAFAFVDGNHRYLQVRNDLLAVDRHLRPGGFMLLHDYYDSRNYEPPEDPRYGVVRAAREVLDSRKDYLPMGRFGCTALYRKKASRLSQWNPLSWVGRLRSLKRSGASSTTPISAEP